MGRPRLTVSEPIGSKQRAERFLADARDRVTIRFPLENACTSGWTALPSSMIADAPPLQRSDHDARDCAAEVRSRQPRPVLSVVVPVRNEALNVAPLVDELEAALAPLGLFEVIYVDDGSSDGTGAVLHRLQSTRPWLRHLRHEASCGQSAAVMTGVLAAAAPVVATLDGDGQNNPAFIPRLMEKLAESGPGCGLVQGQRMGRQSTRFKRWQSKIANKVRGALLQDRTWDTGCGLKCFPREVYLRLPYFDALHRFMPALVQRDGYRVATIDVADRPRLTGQSNYGFFDRLWVGIMDLGGVLWLIRRRRAIPRAVEIDADGS